MARRGEHESAADCSRRPVPLRRLWDVLRRLWLLPETRAILAGNALCLAINVGELCLAAARPCVMSSNLYAEACGNSMAVLQAIAAVKVALMIVVVNHICSPRLAAACSWQLGFIPPAGEIGLARMRGWAAASSKEVFDEVVRVTRESQLQLIVFLALAVAAPSASFIAADLAAARSPEYRAYFERVCPDCWEAADRWPERFAWRWRETGAIVVASMAPYLSSLLLILRLEMWSPVFMDAVKHLDVRWLKRSLWSHWLQLAVSLPTVYVFAIGIKLKLLTATRADMVGFTYAAITVIAGGLLIIAWSSGLDVALLRWLACRVTPARVVPSVESLELYSAAPSYPHSEAGSLSSVEHRKLLTRIRLQRTSKAGFKQRQLQLLINMILLLLGTPFASWVTVGVVWVCRLVAIALVLLTMDTPCTVEQLREAEPGFGVVVDAGHLRAALQAHLSGAAYTGPLLKTRGSYNIMDDTLTISYRWQAEEVEICPGLRLNMSRWQLSEVEQALGASGCMYVWIDRIALPQDESPLQRTLLARMMAVYGSSRKTLALRSLEPDSSRYHQRAWTLQELCNAREVEIVTEPVGEDGAESGLLAINHEEDTVFREAREWHQGRAHSCRPFWLYGLSQAQVSASAARYDSISKQVVCKFTADKVRALYPLIFNTPCEDEAEMLALVVGVAAASRRDISAEEAPPPRPPDFLRELPKDLLEAMPPEAQAFVLMLRSKSVRERLR
eukprot:jgi/Tetstr1/439297/TSEL_027738.t1